MSVIRVNPEKYVPIWAREVELRREIVAAMRLRRDKSVPAYPAAGSLRQMTSPLARPGERKSVRMAESPLVARSMDAPASEVWILEVSDYEGLRSSRQLLLEGAGYRVASVGSRDVLDADWVRRFDIAIVCQSVEPESAENVTAKLRRYHPAIQILRIHSPRSQPHPAFDMEMEGLAGPEALFDAVRKLVERRAREDA
ncbi:MAG TPA: hypothetical protein VKB38_05190 [Terracidiphilus sp.]|nr:hypothetical protein [Terracidiphilus sp.]